MYSHEYVVDNQIVDLYVMERLSPDQKARFEDHFLTCSTCLQDLEITRSFHGDMKDHVVEKLAQVAHVGLLARLLSAGMMRTLPAALIVALAFVGFRSYDKGKQLDLYTQPRLTTALTLDAVRSDGSEGDQPIILPSDQDQLRLVQPILSSYKSARVSLLNKAGKTLLVLKAKGGVDQLSLDLPASFLEPGSYLLRIEGQVGDRYEFYGEYGFVLSKE